MFQVAILKSVFSEIASNALVGIQLPTSWQHLSWHQAETLKALDDPAVDMVVNTAMTGGGKSLAAFLEVLARDIQTLGMCPANELSHCKICLPR